MRSRHLPNNRCQRCGQMKPHSCPPVYSTKNYSRFPRKDGRTVTTFDCFRCGQSVVTTNEPNRYGMISGRCGLCARLVEVRLAEHSRPTPPARSDDPVREDDTYGT